MVAVASHFRAKEGQLNLLSGATGAQAAMQVGTRSVLNPLLWLCGICSTFIVGAVTAAGLDASPWLVAALAFLSAAPVFVALWAYIYFAVKDPDRLQSEPFRIEEKWVQAQIGDNRTHQVITIPSGHSAPTGNAALISQSSNPVPASQTGDEGSSGAATGASSANSASEV